MISQETLALLFAIGLGLGTLLSGAAAGYNQRKMRSRITQHVTTTEADLAAMRTSLAQKDGQIHEIQLESRYNAGKFDTAINMVTQLQRDIVELKQHEADLVRLLKQAYAQIASMKATHDAERHGYQDQIAELQRRIGELEDEREKNRNEISRLNAMLVKGLMEGARPNTGKPKPQPMVTSVPKPGASKQKARAKA